MSWNYADQDIIDEYMEAQYESLSDVDDGEYYDMDDWADFDEQAELNAADEMAWIGQDDE